MATEHIATMNHRSQEWRIYTSTGWLSVHSSIRAYTHQPVCVCRRIRHLEPPKFYHTRRRLVLLPLGRTPAGPTLPISGHQPSLISGAFSSQRRLWMEACTVDSFPREHLPPRLPGVWVRSHCADLHFNFSRKEKLAIRVSNTPRVICIFIF